MVDAGNPQADLQLHSDGKKTQRDKARVCLFTFFWERTFSGLVSPSGLPEKNSSLVQIRQITRPRGSSTHSQRVNVKYDVVSRGMNGLLE